MYHQPNVIALKSFDKWIICTIVFALSYATVLASTISDAALHWDEINHLNGALLLTRGQLGDYAAAHSYYPPLFNLATAGYFLAAGASVFTARLVSLSFTVLSMLLIYGAAETLYNHKVGFLAAVLFGIMPGVVWFSGLAMIESMLIFEVTFSLLSFFRWLQTNQTKYFSMGTAALALGIFVKYQILVIVPLTVLFLLLFGGNASAVRAQLTQPRIKPLWVGVGFVIAVLGFIGVLYGSGLLDDWIYAIQIGNVGQSEYSTRFPAPIFYLVEMVWPYSDMHPVSIVLYGFGLAGLILMAYRRKPADKFLLFWFIVAYVVFTFIPNRQWRYLTVVFPVLAISAAELAASLYNRAQKTWRSPNCFANKKFLAKASAATLVALLLAGVAYSVNDAIVWVSKDRISVPTEEAMTYIASQPQTNGSILVLCPFNRFNRDMVWFYLNSEKENPTPIYQYPMQAVDAYPVEFDITELTRYCQINGTRYVLLYEYEGTPTYYGSSLNEQAVYKMLVETGSFTLEASFGSTPRRMFVFSFNSTA